MNYKELGKKIQSLCKAVVNNKYFGIVIFFLISFSVILIIIELTVVPPGETSWICQVNDCIVYVFIFELAIRWIAIGSFRLFIKEYWIDVIAVLPMLPVLRFLRIYRLLRLLRMVSLLVFMRRHVRAFTYFFKKRIIEFLIIFALVSFVVIFATISYIHFEQVKTGANYEGIQHSFWVTIYSLFAGEYITDFPSTLGGKLILLLVMFSGMSLFAIFTGTVSAIMVERLKEGAFLGKLNFKDMEDHVIICGWNDHVPKIIAEFQGDPMFKSSNFVIIAELEELPDMSYFGVDMTPVYMIKQDFINAETLKFANIEEAAVAIILADQRNNRSGDEADARTVLAALTIEKLNPRIYSCAELIKPENESHLQMSSVESIVITANISAYMMTQAAMKASVVPFYTELLRPSQGNQLHEVPFPKNQFGKEFNDILGEWKARFKSILVGVITSEDGIKINPDIYKIKPGDQAIVIARDRPKIPNQ